MAVRDVVLDTNAYLLLDQRPRQRRALIRTLGDRGWLVPDGTHERMNVLELTGAAGVSRLLMPNITLAESTSEIAAAEIRTRVMEHRPPGFVSPLLIALAASRVDVQDSSAGSVITTSGSPRRHYAWMLEAMTKDCNSGRTASGRVVPGIADLEVLAVAKDHDDRHPAHECALMTFDNDAAVAAVAFGVHQVGIKPNANGIHPDYRSPGHNICPEQRTEWLREQWTRIGPLVTQLPTNAQQPTLAILSSSAFGHMIRGNRHVPPGTESVAFTRDLVDLARHARPATRRAARAVVRLGRCDAVDHIVRLGQDLAFTTASLRWLEAKVHGSLMETEVANGPLAGRDWDGIKTELGKRVEPLALEVCLSVATGVLCAARGSWKNVKVYLPSDDTRLERVLRLLAASELSELPIPVNGRWVPLAQDPAALERVARIVAEPTEALQSGRESINIGLASRATPRRPMAV